MNNNDVKIKYQVLNKEIFNLIIVHHSLSVNDIAFLLKLQKQRVRRHVTNLLENELLNTCKVGSEFKYTAINILKFKKYQEDDMAHYLAQNAKKIVEHNLDHMPAHIKEAIARGLISADSVHSYSPLEDSPDKFKNTPKRHINMAWHGYSVYNIL